MAKGTKITLKLDPIEKIMLKRNLGKNSNGQKFFTHEIRRLADSYVPMDSGNLKNTAVEETGRIIYVQPYAKKQWYTHSGYHRIKVHGKSVRSHTRRVSTRKRGREWVLRMWADRKNEIISSVAKYCGGHT